MNFYHYLLTRMNKQSADLGTTGAHEGSPLPGGEGLGEGEIIAREAANSVPIQPPSSRDKVPKIRGNKLEQTGTNPAIFPKSYSQFPLLD